MPTYISLSLNSLGPVTFLISAKIMHYPTVQETAQIETDNRRSEKRYLCPKLVRIRQVTVPESAFRLSVVENISVSGIGLALSLPLAPGVLLEVELPGRSVIRRFARVVHCTKQERGWLIGCALNLSLSETELERMLS
jgi:hypothetical protein